MNKFDKIYESVLKRVDESNVFKGPSKNEAKKRVDNALKLYINRLFKELKDYKKYGEVKTDDGNYYNTAEEYAYEMIFDDFISFSNRKDSTLVSDAIYDKDTDKLDNFLKTQDIDTVIDTIKKIISTLQQGY